MAAPESPLCTLQRLEEENLALSRSLLGVLTRSSAPDTDRRTPTPQGPSSLSPLLHLFTCTEQTARSTLEGVMLDTLAALATAAATSATRSVSLRFTCKSTAYTKTLPSSFGLHEEYLGDDVVRVGCVPQGMSDGEVAERFGKCHKYFVSAARPLTLRGSSAKTSTTLQRKPKAAPKKAAKAQKAKPAAATSPAATPPRVLPAASAAPPSFSPASALPFFATPPSGAGASPSPSPAYIPSCMRDVWQPVWQTESSAGVGVGARSLPEGDADGVMPLTPPSVQSSTFVEDEGSPGGPVDVVAAGEVSAAVPAKEIPAVATPPVATEKPAPHTFLPSDVSLSHGKGLVGALLSTAPLRGAVHVSSGDL